MPSRLFIDYNERKIEGSVASDSGAQIRDGIMSIHKQGLCPEFEWPYDASPAAPDGMWPLNSVMGEAPPAKLYTEALKNYVITYRRLVQEKEAMKGCLAQGSPFVGGFTVYETFESAYVGKTRVMAMPGPKELAVGGHAVTIVGYDDSKSLWMVRNSWGTSWGSAGYFWMPYQYFTNWKLSTDFWTLRIIF